MNRNKNTKWITFIPYLVVLFAIISLFNMGNGTARSVVSYSALEQIVDTKDVTDVSVSVGTNVISITGVYEEANGTAVAFTTTAPRSDSQMQSLMELFNNKGVEINVSDSEATNIWMDLLINIVPFIIFMSLGYFLISKMGGGANNKAFEFSKNRARLEGNIKVKFADVAGCDEEKQEMEELIDYLKSPKRFAERGARIPKGVLLVGSPGTGKTLLAKAVAGEANVPFYSISGSDFVEMFVGVGASRVREMFKDAKQAAPCIIFIDEIDAVGRQRGAGLGGGHDEREQTLNQMLVEMDGIEENTGILVIAATNRPDVLDPALLRPGRFDRTITVSLPDRRGREAILKVHARNKQLADDVDLGALANRTPGFSGADLENVLNEAAILSVRENESNITVRNIDEAIDRVMMGPAKKSRVYDEKTKKLVAYHEAGHAVIGLFLEDSTVVQKVTIIPRGQAGGYNLMTPKEEKMMNTRSDLLGNIVSLMGGRSAEELYFDDITTGASNDIERATNIARDMVTLYGMSDLGPVKYDNGNQNVFLGRDYNSPTNVSGQVAFEIDQEVRKIIDYSHEKARQIIKEHSDALEKIANKLIEVETLTAQDIEELIFGKKDDESLATNVVAQ